MIREKQAKRFVPVRGAPSKWNWGTPKRAATDPAREARIEAHTARVAAGDPGEDSWVYCWGPCGRALPAGWLMKVSGWASRIVRVHGAEPVKETHCPDCYAAWGFIDPAGGTA